MGGCGKAQGLGRFKRFGHFSCQSVGIGDFNRDGTKPARRLVRHVREEDLLTFSVNTRIQTL